MTTTHRLSKADVQRLQKWKHALNELRENENTCMSITKLTSIKSLCKNECHRNNYCQYLATLVIRNVAKDNGEHNSQQTNELLQEAYRAIISLVDNGDESMARETLLKIISFQNESKKIKWATVRIIKNGNLLILEKILLTLLSRTDTALAYVYDATKNFVEKYNPKYGSGLIADSIPMLEQIISFWGKYE